MLIEYWTIFKKVHYILKYVNLRYMKEKDLKKAYHNECITNLMFSDKRQLMLKA